MLRRTLATVAFAAVAAFAQPAQGQAVLADGVLRDLSGRTLYVFDHDASGQSDCYDACALLWPAFTSRPGVAGGLWRVVRGEGRALASTPPPGLAAASR